MAASYLLRFDDICATMNWPIWSQIEDTLLRAGVRPLLAVVPDNQDPKLQVHEPKQDFWKHVQRWQSFGWTIALHGHQHRYVTTDAGLLNLNSYSEFAGLPFEQQLKKLRTAADIFSQHGVTPRLWIAPAHAFDLATIAALHKVGVHHISDGFSLYPYTDADGTFWIPQQTWRFRPALYGTWTVCMHHNDWSGKDLLRFRRDVERYRTQISSYDEVVARYYGRRKTMLDDVFAGYYPSLLRLKLHCSRIARSFKKYQ